MRKPPVPYKHSGANDVSYSKNMDSSLLSKGRQNFAEGGGVNKSSEDLKQMLTDSGVSERFKEAKASNSSSSLSGFQGGSGGDYGSNRYADDGSQWESQQPRYDKDGMPLRRVLKTQYGNIPLPNRYAKGGVVKGKGK